MQRRIIRKLELETFLSKVKAHPSPKPSLEQYTIPSDVAATILHIAAYTYDDLIGKTVLDLGCGTGRLAIGAAYLGAQHVVGVDIDKKALQLAKKNLGTAANKWELGSLDRVILIRADINHLNLADGTVDLVLQNPPFGVQRRGADILFLQKAIQIAPVVYSIHKAGNTGFIQRSVGCARITHRLQLPFQLPPTQPFHTKRVHKVLAEIYRITREE